MPREPDWFRRRCVLGLLGFGGVAALAGCTGDDAEAEGADSDDEEDGNDEGERTDDGGERTDDEGERTDDEGEGTDDESENGDDESDADESGDDDGADEDVGFEDTIGWEDSYEFETVSDEFDAVGRFDGGNFYMRSTDGDDESEIYIVGDEMYMVEDGQCFVLPDDGGGERPGEVMDLEERVEEAEEEDAPDPELTGRDTIDGEEVSVFVLSAEDADVDGDLTYYVSVETGYLRRFESDDGVVDYDAWGEADPVEPPDMECVEAS